MTTMEELNKLGFELIKSYAHGDNNEFITQIYQKGKIKIERDFNDYKLENVTVTIEEFDGKSLEYGEICILDYLVNKI
jgi:hypothetical protein